MRQTAIFGTFLVFAAVANAADPQLLNLVMPDAKVIGGVNVQQAKSSPFGNFVITQMTNQQQGLQDIVTATGFNPLEDVSEILGATSGDKINPGGIVLARGNFNTATIVAALLKDGKHASSTYAGATLVTSSDANQKDALAFINGTIAIAGDVTSVKAALDRRSANNSLDPLLAAKINTLSNTEDAWTISIASLSGLFPGQDKGASQQLALFKNIVESSGGVKFGANIQVNAQAVTTDPKDATALSDVIKFVSQLVAMQAGKAPEAANAVALLKTLTVTTDGTLVNIALTIPEADIEGLINTAHGTAARKVKI